MADKSLAERRAEHLKAKQDEVNVRLREPWTAKLHDLIMYKAMYNGEGIRLNDIDKLIKQELHRVIPE
jgi:hypothetical protein